MGVQKHVILSVNDTNATIECRTCGPDTEYVVKNTARGPRLACANGQKEQRRQRRLKGTVVFTEKDKFDLLKRQDGRCPICLQDIDMNAHVDHDHVTNKVRGLLCRPCNMGLGLMKDDPEALRRAAEYIENSLK